ncbi:hypothetical protein [Desulfitobacterium hafniense]|uniref:hypothetical protein n=1 Tax=Desulfitobacterium hafniense TaxID=49338 RepID=UPI001FA6E9DE|nr:hypothetical protein [Desulfitobacterium hafniense]
MTKETMRIFFPLKITTYLLNDYDWDDQNPVELSSEEAVAYEDAILTAITNDNRRRFENDRGLAEHIENEALNKKVYSLYPSVEVSDGKLWGVMTAGLTEALSGEETAELLEFVAGENSDGYVPKNNMRRSRPKSWLIPTLMVLYHRILFQSSMDFLKI